jgi:hypothetical protein
MGDLQVKLCGQVLRLNPRRRIATVGIPSVGAGSVVSCRLRDAGSSAGQGRRIRPRLG